MKNLVFLIILVLLFPSCKDIFERNLEKANISLQTPQDDFQSTTFTVLFWWDEVKGADKYRLQIGKPDFNSITQLILDTPITKNQYSFTLNPGKYCWRVRAENNSSLSDYTVRCLSIDSTPDLASQEVVLISPANNFASPQSSFTFRWYSILNSDDYRVEIRTPDFNGLLVLNPAITTDTFIAITGLSEGQYEWGVRGQNTFSNTKFTQRKLIVDATNPALPVLISPANNDTLDGSSMDFTWTQAPDSGSLIYDSLWIYSDSINWTIIKEYYISATTLVVDTLKTGTYFWEMQATDAAGNKSDYTGIRKFFVK